MLFLTNSGTQSSKSSKSRRTTTSKPSLEEKNMTKVPDPNCKGKANGIYTYPNDCRRFLMCSNEIASGMDCPGGEFFDDVKKVCNWGNNLTQARREECAM